MAREKKEREEGQSLPVRREERGLWPFEDWFFESPFAMMRRFRDEIDRMFSEFGFPSFRPWSIASWEPLRTVVPAADVWETDEDIRVRIDLPGVDPKDVEIYTTEDSLRVRAEARREEEERERGYYRAERRYGRYERLIHLPTEVKPDEAKATFKHGVLDITLPKTEEAKQRVKKVPVEVEEEEMAGVKGGKAGEEKQSSSRKR